MTTNVSETSEHTVAELMTINRRAKGCFIDWHTFIEHCSNKVALGPNQHVGERQGVIVVIGAKKT
ncbi:MAG: hypothetical protein AAGF59_02040 [Pseudomonadota bacterium]